MSEIPKQLRDLLFLVSWLRKNPEAPVREVARVLKVPPKDVIAYVRSLVLCGKPPFSPGDLIDIEIVGGKLRLQLDQKLGRPLRFTPQEAVAVTVALRTIAESKAERWSGVAKTLLQKTKRKLGEDVAKRVESIQPRIDVMPDAGSVEQRLAPLQRAVDARRVVEMEYWSASRDALATRRVHPLMTVQHLGTWYLVAHDERSNQVRLFRVDRVSSVKTTDETFTRPASFDPKRYRLDRMFLPGAEVHKARVRLEPAAAPAFVDRWLPREVVKRKDGAVEATIDYVSPDALAAWVLPYGKLAEVLDPPEVRDAVVARAKALRAHYG